MKLNLRPGYYTDYTDIGAEGVFKNGDGVRFRNSLPETVGVSREFRNLTDQPINYRGVARALHDWSDLNGEPWLAVGTSKRLYLYSNEVTYDITPQRAQTTPTDPFQTDNTGAYDPNGLGDARFVRVTDTAHGAREGDVVNFASATAVGGVTIDGDYEIVTIDSVNEYTIRSAVAATSVATGGGTPTITYDINSGLEQTFTVPGYGSSLYGIGVYGESDDIAPTEDGFLLQARVWSLDNWGEDLLAVPDNGTLYWWDKTNGGATKAQVVADAPNRIQRFAVSARFRYAIAFGSSPGTTSDRDPLLIRWSDAEDFTVWAPAVDNTAGDTRIDEGSEIVAHAPSGADFLVWTDESMHRFFFANTTDLWTTLPVASNVRIAGPNAAETAGSITYWMGKDKFYLYDGIHRELPCPVWNRVFDDINEDQISQVHASINEKFTEVRWDYPSSGSDQNDRYVVYNYQERIWYYGTDSYTAVNEKSGLFDEQYGAQGGLGFSDDSSGSIYLMDVESNDPTLKLRRFIDTGDFLLDEGQVQMYIKRLYPNFAKLDGRVDITLYVKESPQHSRYVARRFNNVSKMVQYISPDMRGRQAYMRIQSRFASDEWRMGVPLIEFSADGTR